LEAKEIALIALGERKAAIIRAAVAGPVSAAVPASFLRGHECTTVYLDDLAAKCLDATVWQRGVL
jgi:glucosamine-6-phosphate deaminase